MTRPRTGALRLALATLLAAGLADGDQAAAQSRPARPRPAAPVAPRRPQPLQLRGVGLASVEWFTASQSFDAVLGSSRGTSFGGGLSLTKGPGFLDVTAQRVSRDGERVFVGSNGEVFPLGIATTVSVTPLDVTVGWRLRGPARGTFRGLRPYVGLGYTRLGYEETSDFAGDGENVSTSHNGFHVLGGAEYHVARWVGLAAELMWTSVPDAIGESGVAKDFDETNLGGTSLRVKLVIGR